MSINHHARNASSARAASLSLRGLVHRAGAMLCLVLALMLLVIGKIYPQWTQNVRLSSTAFLTDAASLVARPLDALQSVQNSMSEWAGAVSENRRLHLELQALSHSQAQLQELTAENARLRALSQVTSPQIPLFINARVVSLAGGSAQQSLWINAGEANGVLKDMAVIVPEGVIGRIVEVGETRARVLLMTDALSRLPVQMGQTRYHAIASGQDGSGLLSLRHLPMHAELQPGEIVVTAGDGNLLPVGIPVGMVEAVPATDAKEGQSLWRIRPLADLSRLDTVSVVQLPDGTAAATAR